MAAINITLFDMPRIERDGVTVAVERRKSLALLAYLAITGQPTAAMRWRRSSAPLS